MVLFQNCVWWSRPLTKMAAQLYLVGYHSVVALLLKAALIQVSDYRLLGASGYYSQFE